MTTRCWAVVLAVLIISLIPREVLSETINCTSTAPCTGNTVLCNGVSECVFNCNNCEGATLNCGPALTGFAGCTINCGGTDGCKGAVIHADTARRLDVQCAQPGQSADELCTNATIHCPTVSGPNACDVLCPETNSCQDAHVFALTADAQFSCNGPSCAKMNVHTLAPTGASSAAPTAMPSDIPSAMPSASPTPQPSNTGINLNNTYEEYQALITQLSAPDAQTFCSSHCNSDLLSLHSTAEHLRAVDACIPLAPMSDLGCWLGLNDLQLSEGEFGWSDGSSFDYGSSLTGSPWTPGDPDDETSSGSSGADCVLIEFSNSAWSDTGCSDGNSYLCNNCTFVLNKYIAVDEELYHDQAQAYCQSQFGTDLASLHSYADWQEAALLCSLVGDLDCFIGLYHPSGAAWDEFAFQDGTAFDYGTVMEQIPWERDEPSDGDDYVRMSGADDYKWMDIADWDYNFVCNSPISNYLCPYSRAKWSPTNLTSIQSSSCDSWQWNNCEISMSGSESRSKCLMWLALNDYTPYKLWTDFTVETIFAIQQNASATTNLISGDAGLVIRALDVNHFYYIGLRADSSLVLGHVVDGLWTALEVATNAAFTFAYDTYYRLRIEVRLNEILTYMNGAPMHSFVDHNNTYEYGSIGLRTNNMAENTTVTFKTLWISGTVLEFGPTVNPTSNTFDPSVNPSAMPSIDSSAGPTAMPSDIPSAMPSGYPTQQPSSATGSPTVVPSANPSGTPSLDPTDMPSFTSGPSTHPSRYPSVDATAYPSLFPTAFPTIFPSAVPSVLPTKNQNEGNVGDEDGDGQGEDNNGQSRTAKNKSAFLNVLNMDRIVLIVGGIGLGLAVLILLSCVCVCCYLKKNREDMRSVMAIAIAGNKSKGNGTDNPMPLQQHLSSVSSISSSEIITMVPSATDTDVAHGPAPKEGTPVANADGVSVRSDSVHSGNSTGGQKNNNTAQSVPPSHSPASDTLLPSQYQASAEASAVVISSSGSSQPQSHGYTHNMNANANAGGHSGLVPLQMPMQIQMQAISPMMLVQPQQQPQQNSMGHYSNVLLPMPISPQNARGGGRGAQGHNGYANASAQQQMTETETATVISGLSSAVHAQPQPQPHIVDDSNHDLASLMSFGGYINSPHNHNHNDRNNNMNMSIVSQEASNMNMNMDMRLNAMSQPLPPQTNTVGLVIEEEEEDSDVESESVSNFTELATTVVSSVALKKRNNVKKSDKKSGGSNVDSDADDDSIRGDSDFDSDPDPDTDTDTSESASQSSHPQSQSR